MFPHKAAHKCWTLYTHAFWMRISFNIDNACLACIPHTCMHTIPDNSATIEHACTLRVRPKPRRKGKMWGDLWNCINLHFAFHVGIYSISVASLWWICECQTGKVYFNMPLPMFSYQFFYNKFIKITSRIMFKLATELGIRVPWSQKSWILFFSPSLHCWIPHQNFQQYKIRPFSILSFCVTTPQLRCLRII